GNKKGNTKPQGQLVGVVNTVVGTFIAVSVVFGRGGAGFCCGKAPRCGDIAATLIFGLAEIQQIAGLRPAGAACVIADMEKQFLLRLFAQHKAKAFVVTPKYYITA